MKYLYLGDSVLDEQTVTSFGGKAGKLHELLAAGFPVPRGFVLQSPVKITEEAIQKIGGFPVAVRSSGSLEDLGDASFAGQYETFLFVKSMEELQSRIEDCFNSKDSQRVKDYLETKKIAWTPESLKMSVLVQKMVDAKIAGVLFTMNPLNGCEEEMYLELCEGVGERLVSGHVTPTQIVYNWFDDRKVSETINSEKTTITDQQLNQLIELSAKIQAHYGKPQDIEWAVGADNNVYILQSRPVTTFTPRTDKPELTNADLKDGGISARVCSPFMYSAYREALKNSMGDYFKRINLIPNDENIQWIHFHYGRVYWNAEAVKEGLKKIPDFKEDDFDRDLGVQKDYGDKGPHRTPLSISAAVNAIPILIGLNREFTDCEIMINHFRVRFEMQDEELKSSLPKLSKMSEVEFRNWFLEVILYQNETEKNYFRTIYNNSNFQSEYKSYLKKLKAYQEGDEVDLMGELHGVAHLDVQGGLKKLRKAADFFGFDSNAYHKARVEFLKTHYHHGPAELDLLVPRWGERTDWVDELVANFHEVVSSNNISKFEVTSEKIAKGVGVFGKAKFWNFTNRSRDFLRLREEMRSYSTRAYYLLRKGLLEFAKRNELPEKNAFMLDLVEVKRKVLNPDYQLPDVSKRILFFDGYRHFKAPNEFGGSITALKTSMKEGMMKGLGCSPGEFIGTARVIMDIHATGNLTKDEILVTAFTDPGWTPVLARVGGVITEVGGLLSHAAVIGREYGIPAILNLIDATRIIQDGDKIKINGKTGVVEVLEKGPKS